MAKLRFQISMSLDGFIAGPNPSEKDPLGVVPVLLGGGTRLFENAPADAKLEILETVEAPGVTHLKYRMPS